MALPALQSNIQINGNSSGSAQNLGTQTSGQLTAYKAVNTSGGAVTCNLSTDTMIFRGDGAIWDDTQSCWVSVDKYISRGIIT